MKYIFGCEVCLGEALVTQVAALMYERKMELKSMGAVTRD